MLFKKKLTIKTQGVSSRGAGSGGAGETYHATDKNKIKQMFYEAIDIGGHGTF